VIEFTLPIVGIDFPNPDRRGTNRRSALMMMAPGDPVELRAEPSNRHDEHAVAVFDSDGLQLGYLPAERAPAVSARLRRGEDVSALFQGMSGGGAFLRLRLGGGAPTLPPVRAAPPPMPAPDFEVRDPDSPDWGA